MMLGTLWVLVLLGHVVGRVHVSLEVGLVVRVGEGLVVVGVGRLVGRVAVRLRVVLRRGAAARRRAGAPGVRLLRATLARRTVLPATRTLGSYTRDVTLIQLSLSFFIAVSWGIGLANCRNKSRLGNI